jgi:hypothetical protein
MEENVKMSEVVEEIKGASDEELKAVIERWFEQTRTSGMKIGASFISIAVYDAIKKNLKSGINSSHRDFERAIKSVLEIVSVQLKQNETVQNDLEEVVDDGTAE